MKKLDLLEATLERFSLIFLKARAAEPAANSLAAYERTCRIILAWSAAAVTQPPQPFFPTALEAYRFLGEG